MITLVQMRIALHSVTYKRRVMFEVLETWLGNEIMLSISMPVVDANDGFTDTNFNQTKPVPKEARKSRETFLDYVYTMVLAAETHEVNEWFRVDDEHWIEPHPENSPAHIAKEQARYMGNKHAREMGAPPSSKAMEPMPEYARYKARFYNSDFRYDRAPPSRPSYYDEISKFKDSWFSFELPKPKKATPKGIAKKKKRAKSAHKKGLSNKSWDALRK